MGLLSPHLDDAAFADAWADRLTRDGDGDTAAAKDSTAAHLRACAECRSRYAEFSGWLETLRTDAVDEADEVFTADRLAVQQAQIARRLEALEHPARVIAFPHLPRPAAGQPSGRQRWVAAAAAAGLLVGVGLGQVFQFGTSRTPAPIASAPVQQEQQIARGNTPVADTAMGVLPASIRSDEAILYDLDSGPSQVLVPESLQYLNAITPGARDYDPR